MLKKILSISLCVQCCIVVHAQNGKWAATLSPATVQMPEWYMAIQPGMQYRPNSRVAIIVEVCIPVMAMARNSSISDQTYSRLKGELKYYLNSKSPSPYISIESSYALREFTAENSCYHKGIDFDTVVYRYQRANVRSPIWVTNLKIGREYRFGPHFGFDIFAGMGFRNISTQYSDLKEVTREAYFRPFCQIFPSTNPAWWYDANVYRFNATFGFRFMYQF